MKKLITTCTLLISIGLFAQNVPGSTAVLVFDETSNASDEIRNDNIAPVFKEKERTFKEEARANKIATRSFSDLDGVTNGYYTITGVYGDGRNLKKNIKKLKKKGFDAGSLLNPENGLNYVYLQYNTDWRRAIEACVSDFDGTYKDDIWILNVENSNPIVFEDGIDFPPIRSQKRKNVSDKLAVEEVTYNMLNDSGDEIPNKVTKESPNKSKLIQKADYYFEKMWYAEAAELYEAALKKGEKNYSYDIIQKAGDAHYFNTNMEKAFHWYDILYTKYGKEMSADNLFKYAHSLKGTGKYGRAKRLMRLYNRKLERGDASPNGDIEHNPTPNEIVLDNILGASEKNFDIKSMGINTEYSDFAPMFLDSNQVVFASAKTHLFLIPDGISGTINLI